MAQISKDQQTRVNLASRMRKGTVRNVSDIKSILASHKVNVNARSKLGWSPLMIACAKGEKDIVKFLLDHGADPNAVSTKGGNTPMHYASLDDYCGCLRGNTCNYSVYREFDKSKTRIDILRLLISHGATLQCNSDGLDPPCLAALHKLHDIVDFFVQRSTCRLKLSDEEKVRACEIFGVAFALNCHIGFYDCTGDVAPYEYLCRALSIREGSGTMLPIDHERSEIAAHFSLFSTKECKTQKDWKQIKLDPWAVRIQCFLVADRVLPKKMKNGYLFPRLLNHGQDGLFFFGKGEKRRTEGSLIFREAIQWELQSKVKPGFVLQEILNGIHLVSPDLCPEDDAVEECYKLLDLCLQELREVSKTSLHKVKEKLVDNLGSFLYDLALYDFCKSKEMSESLLLFGERMIGIVRGRCGRNTPSVTHHILAKIDELFWHSKNKGRMKENRVKRLISRVVQCEDATQISEGNSMLHSLLDVVSYADGKFIKDTSLILIRNGCEIEARNRSGETVREMLCDPIFFYPNTPEKKELKTLISPPTSVLRLEEIAARTILRHKIPHEGRLPKHLSVVVRGELEPDSELFPTYAPSESSSDSYIMYYDDDEYDEFAEWDEMF